MLKKLICILFFAIPMCTSAQEEVKLKAGTMIPLQVLNPTRAAEVHKGDKVLFQVVRDIAVNGQTVIPYGTLVNGVVYEAKRSSWFGTKGRLGININEINLPGGQNIPLNNGNVYVEGTNRTAVSVLLFLFITWPACFICGGKAELQNGYTVQTFVDQDTILQLF